MKKSSTPPPRSFSRSGNMIRAIVIEVLLLFIFAVLIASSAWFLKIAVEDFQIALKISPNDTPNDTYFLEYARLYLAYGLPSLFAAVADIVVIVLVALKEFPVFKPLIDKHKARKLQRKLEKTKAEAIQAEEYRKSRIEQLQAELEDLKKNEKEL